MRLVPHLVGRLRPLFAVGVLGGALAVPSLQQADRAGARPIVHVVPIEGMIDLGLAPFVQRVLAQAARDSAALVIFDINTFGGRVDAAVLIRDAILSSEVRTVAFINRRAISAGALISLAAHTIAIADGGTIGAATPVQAAPGGQAAEQPPAVQEKSVSYMRKEFRSTADARGRPPLIAEAMVDADVVIDGLIEKGKLLTLTTEEALTHGVADFRANDIGSVLDSLGLAGAELRHHTTNWAEGFVRLLTNPIVASLLLSVGMLGILVEIRSPGFGVAGGVGVASLALVLWGHWIVALVGSEELLLLGAGAVLLGIELLVIPGFGVFGALGIAAILGAFSFAFVGSGATASAMLAALSMVAISMLFAIALSLVLLRNLGRLPFGRRLTLTTELDATSAPSGDLTRLGQVGRTAAPLRPAGIALFDGERVDVVSEGEMIDAGVPVVVSRVDGNRIVVRRQQSTEGEQ